MQTTDTFLVIYIVSLDMPFWLIIKDKQNTSLYDFNHQIALPLRVYLCEIGAEHSAEC